MTKTKKPVVHYRGTPAKMGESAYLHPVDHPNHLDGHSISNKNWVFTSRVVVWDGDRIETENTIYMPELVEEALAA